MSEDNTRNVRLSRVQMLLDEMRSGIQVDTTKDWWSQGNHPEVLKKPIDPQTEKAFEDLLEKKIKRDAVATNKLHERSLEIQTWWRDRQLVDVQKEKAAQEEVRMRSVRRIAVNKIEAAGLTDEEKMSLGLDKILAAIPPENLEAANDIVESNLTGKKKKATPPPAPAAPTPSSEGTRRKKEPRKSRTSKSRKSKSKR